MLFRSLLITGPTGSGKTTTLYTALSKLDASAHKIITVEEPVEYQLEGINQIQVHQQIGRALPAPCAPSCGRTPTSS